MGEHLTLRGELVGHGGWVTALATTPEDPNLLLSASRDKVSNLSLNSSIYRLNATTNHRLSLPGSYAVRKATMVMLNAP
jgi:hypothetical protein